MWFCVYISHVSEYIGCFLGVMVVEMEVIFTVELGKLNETSASCLPSPQLESIAVIPPLSMMPTRGYCFIGSYSSAAIS